MDKQTVLKLIDDSLVKQYGCTMAEATEKQIYRAICTSVRDMLAQKNKAFKDEYLKNGTKKVYYMSMEFLVGTSLRNNLFNLGIENDFREALRDKNYDIEKFYDMEPDAGLGNGGLGRLASCYMDTLSGLDMPATGFSIKYDFGIFKQKIVDGWQMEFPDDWQEMGGVWLTPHDDETYLVKFGGHVNGWMDNGKYRVSHTDYNAVVAVPYDMYISGYDSKGVNKLTLWGAKSADKFDMSAFSRGDYAKSLESSTMAEVITKVLYPADNHIQGKRLRLQQQYLLVSASLQHIVSKHFNRYGTVMNLPDVMAIHINDTHPALCVPELMRLLIDDYELEWDDAWSIVERTLSYTNHTVMSEALERWNEGMFAELLPRVYEIVREIDRRTRIVYQRFYGDDWGKINYMAVIADGEIRMHNLCLAACHKINGVSMLHSNILKDSLFHDHYVMDPERFTNVTNGIAYRRWLCQANPDLTSYLTELIGDGFKKDSTELEKLLKYKGDKEVLAELRNIKYKNKLRLANYVSSSNGVNLDPDSIFDIQVKRLHEYKRQLLNALQIIRAYLEIKDNPNGDYVPHTYIFSAKASSGYFMAKQIIKLIVTLSDLINSDPQVRDKMKVVFVENYRVSLAETIIPAAELSEQISIAGKEASGTGNMKLMINGAVTIGTLDGANVEIHEQVGDDNIFLFGLKADEVEALWRSGYDPNEYLKADAELQRVIAFIRSGIRGVRFDEIVGSLFSPPYGNADVYMSIADFRDYTRAQKTAAMTYLDKDRFTDMSLVNIAKAGIFSADRAIHEYAKNIWYTEK